jgi:hypothetical protein
VLIEQRADQIPQIAADEVAEQRACFGRVPFGPNLMTRPFRRRRAASTEAIQRQAAGLPRTSRSFRTEGRPTVAVGALRRSKMTQSGRPIEVRCALEILRLMNFPC